MPCECHMQAEKIENKNPQHNMRNKGTDIPFIPENELHILSIVYRKCNLSICIRIICRKFMAPVNAFEQV